MICSVQVCVHMYICVRGRLKMGTNILVISCHSTNVHTHVYVCPHTHLVIYIDINMNMNLNTCNHLHTWSRQCVCNIMWNRTRIISQVFQIAPGKLMFIVAFLSVITQINTMFMFPLHSMQIRSVLFYYSLAKWDVLSVHVSNPLKV